MNEFLVIEPNGTEEVGRVKLVAGADYKDIAAVLAPLFPGADFERVRVFISFRGDPKLRYRDMFVDEDGQGKGLPVNLVASSIYHNNVLMHEVRPPNPADLPKIYGRAVLFRDPVWS